MSGDPFIRLRETATLSGDRHQRWRDALVAVIGVGNLGSRFALEAVRSGAGVFICDPDTGRTENLGTQQVQIGELKAASVADACNSIFPSFADRAEYLVEDIRHAGVAVLERCDLIVDTTDDPDLVHYLTRMSNGLGRPLLRLALDGEGSREFGRVLVSDGGNGFSCQACTYEPESRRRNRTPCEKHSDAPPTRAGGAIGMTVAGVGLLYAQRIVTGCKAEMRDQEVLVDLDNLQLLPQTLERCPDCVTGHERWEVLPLPQTPDDVNLDLIFDLARDQFGDIDVEVDLELHREAMRLSRLEGQELGLLEQPVTRLGVPPRGGVILARAAGHPPIAYLMK